MNGLPSNDAQMQAKVVASRTILLRCVQILRAAFMAGAQVSLEQPRNALSWNEPFVQSFVRDLRLDLVVAAVCHWGADFFKHWIFGTTFRALQQLQGVCTHGKDFHPPFAGIRDSSGNYLSRATAMFPQALADTFAEIVCPLFEVKASSPGALP